MFPPRKHKKKSDHRADEYEHGGQQMTGQSQTAIQTGAAAPPPTLSPLPPPKRTGSMYEQQRLEKDRYPDGEQRQPNDIREQRGLPTTMRGERHDYKDDNRSKSHFSKLTDGFKSFIRDDFGYDDAGYHEQRYPPGHYPIYDDRGSHQSRESLMRDIERLRGDNQALIQDRAELIRNLHQANINVDQSAATTDRIQKTMDSKEHFLGDQALDDEVRSHFLRLMANIRTWTSKLEPIQSGALDFSQMNDTTKKQLDLVAPGCLNPGVDLWTEKAGKKMRMLFRGWLGYVISQEVLRVRTGFVSDNNSALDLWLPQKVRSAIAIVEDDLGSAANISRKSFNNWRALSCELLLKINYADLKAESETEQEQLIASIMSVVRPFIPSEETETAMKESLNQTIVVEAVKFSRFLRKQRPAWLVVDIEQMSPPKVGTARGLARYSPAYMVDNNLDNDDDVSKLSVKMFISPALVKRGNLEGDDYESQDCVSKAIVITV